MQVIGKGSEPFLSDTVPGVITICGPLCVEMVHDAPGTPSVSTAITWVVPLVLVAHAASSSAHAKIAMLRNKTVFPPEPCWTIQQPTREFKSTGWQLVVALTSNVNSAASGMGFNRRKMDDERRRAADKEAAARRALDPQVMADAERLIVDWNERQAKRMPLVFAPMIGAAVTARHWFLWSAAQPAA